MHSAQIQIRWSVAILWEKYPPAGSCEYLCTQRHAQIAPPGKSLPVHKHGVVTETPCLLQRPAVQWRYYHHHPGWLRWTMASAGLHFWIWGTRKLLWWHSNRTSPVWLCCCPGTPSQQVARLSHDRLKESIKYIIFIAEQRQHFEATIVRHASLFAVSMGETRPTNCRRQQLCWAPNRSPTSQVSSACACMQCSHFTHILASHKQQNNYYLGMHVSSLKTMIMDPVRATNGHYGHH